MQQLKETPAKFNGFGDTGEFILAERRDGTLHFLLPFRNQKSAETTDIPLNATAAEPMRLALAGKSGTMIGIDYRGEEVVAAYEPVGSFGWGLVAKIDLEEIRKPHLESALYTSLGALALFCIGGLMFIHFTRPLAQSIENNRQYNRMLFNESPIGLALCDIDGELIDVNPAYAAIIGRSVEETLALTYWDITPGEYADKEVAQLDKLFKNGCYGPYEKEYLHKDGHRVQVRLSGCLLELEGLKYIWSSVEDISAEKSNEEALREAALVFEHTHEAIMITDPEIRIVRTNKRFEEITGYGFGEVADKNPRLLKSGKHDPEFYVQMWQTVKTKGTWYGEMWNRRKDGVPFATRQSITAVTNDSGEITGYVSVFSDISEQKANEEKLAYLASHDALTELPNRLHFANNLSKTIQRAKRHNSRFAVLFMDMDRFKEVNDTLGHEIGDRLLQEVARRLRNTLREEDTVARFGGDEFAVILPDIHSNDDALKIAQKIAKAIEEPVVAGVHTLHPSTSIGVSIYPEHGSDGDALLGAADTAMYTAKETKHVPFVLYTA